MKRDALLLVVSLASGVLVFWSASRAFNTCPTTLSGELSVNAGNAGGVFNHVNVLQESAESWLGWNRRPQDIPFRLSDGMVEHGSERSDRSTTIDPTEVVLHAAGNTAFENLYVYDGAIHIVTDNSSALPELKHITSNGVSLNLGHSNPSDEDIRVLSVQGAEMAFGGAAAPWEGMTWMVTEHHEFIAHYYHYTAEILLSLQRTTSALNRTLPPPARIIFPHSTHSEFRDGPGMNVYVNLAAFPNTQILFSDTWADLRATKWAFKLERVVLFDRAGAMGGPAHGKSWKPISEAMSLSADKADWWADVRERVVRFAGGDAPRPGSASSRETVVTYVSRQRGNRRALRSADHATLIQALQRASEELGFELNIVQLEGMSKAEQIQLAARTTVLIGVHGNGLTSLVWMRPSKYSAVFEFFMPGGWFRDYEITARSLNIMYRGFWNDTSFSYPGFQGRDVEGFHSAEIPVFAPHVIDQLREALQYGLADHVLEK